MDSTTKRLNRLEAALKRQRDPVYTVVMKDGTEVVCNYETAWAYFRDGNGHLVSSVTVDREDYIENAKLLEVLCKS